jgi:hypothetical protein
MKNKIKRDELKFSYIKVDGKFIAMCATSFHKWFTERYFLFAWIF